LTAHQKRFDVISHNLANANTIGFKNSKVNFQDQLSQTMKYGVAPDSSGGVGIGGINSSQIGLGVKIGSITKDMSQGVIETTNRPLDMAINGDGYFVYNKNGKDFFSRAGAVSRDTQGNLVDTGSGYYLQGYNVESDSNGRPIKNSSNQNVLSRSISNINIEPGVISQPKQTENIIFNGNLDRDIEEGTAQTASIKVFDNTGGARNLALTFTKTANPGEFSITGQIDGEDVALSESTLTFNTDGTLASPLDIGLTAADLNATLGNTLFDESTPKDINIQLGNPDSLTAGSITNFSGISDITASQQDGYEAGDLVGLDVDEKGKVRGTFTNGRNEILGQVVIAKFTNSEGLLNMGNNMFSENINSGIPNYGTALENFPSSSIIGRALEQSNVDLTSQFTDMISTQRAFEAASRSITVTDQMLQEVNNLKR
jgi:flagellar hook protein FlgE